MVLLSYGIFTLNLISPKLGAFFKALFSSCDPLLSIAI